MCFPSWHDEARASSALIGGGGSYAITPTEPYVWGGYYEPASLIWHSRWITNDATIECREALGLPGRRDSAVVLRRIMAIKGTARVHTSLNPRSGYGDDPVRGLKLDDTGVWRGIVGNTQRMAGRRQREATAGRPPRQDAGPNGHDRRDTRLRPRIRRRHRPGRRADARTGMARHYRRLEGAVPPLENTVAQRDTRHAYAVLHGLTSSGGGMVAAATTSLPERARRGRNYDYRYAWIRDQCLAGQAIAAAGPHPLIDDAVTFVPDRLLADGADLAPAYTVGGGPAPTNALSTSQGTPAEVTSSATGSTSSSSWTPSARRCCYSPRPRATTASTPTAWRAAEIAAEAIASRSARTRRRHLGARAPPSGHTAG